MAYFCRYDKDVNPDTCAGCEEGCLTRKPVAYINKDFEDAIKELELQMYLKKQAVAFRSERQRRKSEIH